jgi:prepilin-type N-terminal cleavage/methylation domain-containing protein
MNNQAKSTRLNCARGERTAGSHIMLQDSAAGNRTGFTLVELMITMAIIVILSALTMGALGSAEESARVSHTRALIARLHTLIMDRYESYSSRRLPIAFGSGNNNELSPAAAAQLKCWCVRDLMRMELPDRFTDVADKPAATFFPPGISSTKTQIPRSAVSTSYFQVLQRAGILPAGASAATGAMVVPGVNTTYQGADCLYLIVTMGLEENDVLENFQQADIGSDPNYPQLQCFVDAWGNPIQFLRWAPGFNSPMQPMNAAANEWPTDPDQTDPLGVYGKTYANGGRLTGTLGGNPPRLSFALYPLIYSAGPDGYYDIVSDTSPSPLHYAIATSTSPSDDPFYNLGSTTTGALPIGTPSINTSINTTGSLGSVDNIHNQEIGSH